MSTIIASKLKFPDSNKKELEYQIENAKDETALIKQIKNIKLTKYSKYFGNNIQNIEMAVLKIKENKKSLIIPKASNIFKSKNENTSFKSNEKMIIPSLENFGLKNDNLKKNEMEINKSKLKLLKKKSKCESLETQKIQNFLIDRNLDIITEQEISTHETNRDITGNHSFQNSKSPRFYKEINLNLGEYEVHIKENPQYCVEYFPEIYKNFKLEERTTRKIKDYMKYQNDLNEKMRAILVDWIVDVNNKFKLQTETLFLAVNLLDIYLSNKVIQRDQLQLVGVASLLIATKYEEIYSPDIRDFEYITDQGYTKREILEMEYSILKIIQFNITYPSSFRFYEIITTYLSFNPIEFYFGLYLLELFLIDYRSTNYFNSIKACSACFLVLSLNAKNDDKNKISYCLKEFIEHNKEDNEIMFKECCRDIYFIFENIDNTQLSSVKKKFSSDAFYRVSNLFSKSLSLN